MIDNGFNRQQYAKNVDDYLQHNSQGKIGGGTPETRAELLTKYLPKERTIFEIGSGGGDNAVALQKSGYSIITSDYVEEFVNKLLVRGLIAQNFDAKKDAFPTVDAVYANAVFVHFTPEEVGDCLKRAKDKLMNERIFFFSVIKGNGQERSARNSGFERDFYYHNLETLRKVIENEGYEIIYSDDNDPKWLQVICKVR